MSENIIPSRLGFSPSPAADSASAKPVRRMGRRRRTALSLLAFVLLPTAVTGAYEFGIAADQYSSSFQFVVRHQVPEDVGHGSVMSALSGSNPMLAAVEDPEVVTQYIGSHQILHDLEGQISMAEIYGTAKADWLTRLAPGASQEEKLRFWRDMVRPFFDLTSAVVTVDAHAFSPQDAKLVAAAVLAASERMVNRMSSEARTRAMAYAQANVNEARNKLRADETAIARYRNTHDILFPQMTAGVSNSVLQRLRSQLADARATVGSLMAAGQNAASVQVEILNRRITATTAEISRLDGTMTGSSAAVPTLASVLRGYDALTVDEKLDRQLYASDLTALQVARNVADQQQVYLETFVRPNLPVTSTYPRRWLITSETAVAAFVVWCLGMLLIHGVRDHLP